MNDLIRLLKDNKVPFGLMSEEMQAKAREIGAVKDFLFMTGYTSDEWVLCAKEQNIFSWHLTYRLRPDYEDEPETVECEIYRSRRGNFYIDVYAFENDGEVGLDMIPVGYKRIGFKFKGGTVMGSPVKYSVPDITSHGYYASYEDLKTKQALEHHATHVLFRRKKKQE